MNTITMTLLLFLTLSGCTVPHWEPYHQPERGEPDHAADPDPWDLSKKRI